MKNMKYLVIFVVLIISNIPTIFASHVGALVDPIPWPLEYYLIISAIFFSIPMSLLLLLKKKSKIQQKR